MVQKIHNANPSCTFTRRKSGGDARPPRSRSRRSRRSLLGPARRGCSGILRLRLRLRLLRPNAGAPRRLRRLTVRVILAAMGPTRIRTMVFQTSLGLYFEFAGLPEPPHLVCCAPPILGCGDLARDSREERPRVRRRIQVESRPRAVDARSQQCSRKRLLRRVADGKAPQRVVKALDKSAQHRRQLEIAVVAAFQCVEDRVRKQFVVHLRVRMRVRAADRAGRVPSMSPCQGPTFRGSFAPISSAWRASYRGRCQGDLARGTRTTGARQGCT